MIEVSLRCFDAFPHVWLGQVFPCLRDTFRAQIASFVRTRLGEIRWRAVAILFRLLNDALDLAVWSRVGLERVQSFLSLEIALPCRWSVKPQTLRHDHWRLDEQSDGLVGWNSIIIFFEPWQLARQMNREFVSFIELVRNCSSSFKCQSNVVTRTESSIWESFRLLDWVAAFKRPRWFGSFRTFPQVCKCWSVCQAARLSMISSASNKKLSYFSLLKRSL